MLTEKLEIKVFTLNYIQKSDTNMVLTSLAEMEATFDCFTTYFLNLIWKCFNESHEDRESTETDSKALLYNEESQ